MNQNRIKEGIKALGEQLGTTEGRGSPKNPKRYWQI